MRALIAKTLIVVMAFVLLMAGSIPAQAQGAMFQEYTGSVGKAGHTITLIGPLGNEVISPIKADRSGKFSFSVSERELKKYKEDGLVISIKDSSGNEVHRERVGIIVVDGTLGIEPGDLVRPKRFR